jgi:hypothetical protein
VSDNCHDTLHASKKALAMEIAWRILPTWRLHVGFVSHVVWYMIRSWVWGTRHWRCAYIHRAVGIEGTLQLVWSQVESGPGSCWSHRPWEALSLRLSYQWQNGIELGTTSLHPQPCKTLLHDHHAITITACTPNTQWMLAKLLSCLHLFRHCIFFFSIAHVPGKFDPPRMPVLLYLCHSWRF